MHIISYARPKIIFLIYLVKNFFGAEQSRKEYLRQQKEMQAWQNLPLGHPLKQPSGEDIARLEQSGELLVKQVGSNLQIKGKTNYGFIFSKAER